MYDYDFQKALNDSLAKVREKTSGAWFRYFSFVGQVILSANELCMIIAGDSRSCWAICFFSPCKLASSRVIEALAFLVSHIDSAPTKSKSWWKMMKLLQLIHVPQKSGCYMHKNLYLLQLKKQERLKGFLPDGR